MGLPQESGAPLKRKCAAKGGRKNRGRKDDERSKMCWMWKKRNEYSVYSRKCGKGKEMSRVQKGEIKEY